MALSFKEEVLRPISPSSNKSFLRLIWIIHGLIMRYITNSSSPWTETVIIIFKIFIKCLLLSTYRMLCLIWMTSWNMSSSRKCKRHNFWFFSERNTINLCTLKWVEFRLCKLMSLWSSILSIVCYISLIRSSPICRNDITKLFFWKICRTQMILRSESKPANLQDSLCQKGFKILMNSFEHTEFLLPQSIVP